MHAFARPPENLTNTKPLDKTWKLWKESFLIFLKVVEIDCEQSNKNKAALLKNVIGKFGYEEILKIENELGEKLNDFDELLKKLDNHFDPPKIEAEERNKFFTRSKKKNESIEAFISDLTEKAKTCNFGNLTESLIRDMVILDLKDTDFRNNLLKEKDLNLPNLILIYKEYERNLEKTKDILKKMSSVNQTKPQNQNATSADISKKEPTHTCWRCGISHPPRRCPAFNEECLKCHEKGHFTVKCQKSQKNYVKK